MTYVKSDNTPSIHENLPKRLDWIEDGIVNAGGSVQVTDGTHTVAAATEVNFTSGATVTDAGGGIADVAISAGAISPLTTKGDVWGFSTANARIPIGSNGQVLTADSTQALGLKWSAPTGASNDVTVYVAAPTGVAATDTAAIQAAHDSLPSTGGLVLLGQGTYVLNPASPLAFSKPIYLKGQGRKATLLTLDSATVTPIGVTATGVIFEDFLLQNVHATAPTAGAGISVTSNGNRTRYRDIEIDSFYIGIDQQAGNGWTAERCFINDYKSIGIKVQNTAATDSGDGLIVNCQISSTVAATTNGILFNSGGNLRIIGNQMYGGDAGNSNVGIAIAPLDGVNTSDILIYSNSIENFVYGIQGQLPGTATGVLSSINIVGNEIFATAGGDAANFNMSTSGRFSELLVSGNRMTGGARGLVVGNVDYLTVGPNISNGSTPLTFTNAVTHAGGAMTKLYDSTLGVDTASIDTGANSIPSGFSAIQIRFIGRTDDAATTGGIDITLNNDTGANYDIEALTTTNATVTGVASNAQTKWGFTVTGNTATANFAGMVMIDVPNYDGTTFYKAGRASLLRATDSATDCRTDHQALAYRSTSAVSRVKVAARNTAKLKAGSRLVVYGMP